MELSKKTGGFAAYTHICEAMKPFVHAYIDPGLGALIWRTMVSALAGVFHFKKNPQSGGKDVS